MRIEVSTTIDRPLAEVWRWYAVEHVRNHPRWDPDMGLEQSLKDRSGSARGSVGGTCAGASLSRARWRS
jgi:hypothetical protein